MSFIQNIFSIKNEKKYTNDNMVKVYKVITLFFIKIKWKRYEYYKPTNRSEKILECFDNFMYNYWLSLGGTNEFSKFIQNFEFAAELSNFEIPQRTTLVLISSFLEENAFEKAEYLLEKYLKKYPRGGGGRTCMNTF